MASVPKKGLTRNRIHSILVSGLSIHQIPNMKRATPPKIRSVAIAYEMISTKVHLK